MTTTLTSPSRDTSAALTARCDQLRAALKAAGWTVEAGPFTEAERDDMQRDYGLEA